MVLIISCSKSSVNATDARKVIVRQRHSDCTVFYLSMLYKYDQRLRKGKLNRSIWSVLIKNIRKKQVSGEMRTVRVYMLSGSFIVIFERHESDNTYVIYDATFKESGEPTPTLWFHALKRRERVDHNHNKGFHTPIPLLLQLTMPVNMQPSPYSSPSYTVKIRQ